MTWYYECGGVYNINNQKIFGRKVFVSPSELQDTVNKRFNNIDAYSTNYMYNEEDQNQSDIIGPLYIDLDGDISTQEGYNKIKQDTLLAISYLNTHLKVPKEYIQIYFSGSKGFHLIVPHEVFGIQPCKDLNSKYKTIALELSKHTLNQLVDTRIYDKKRLIRMPHSINGKTGLYKVPMSEDMLRMFTSNTMKHYAKADKHVEIPEAKLVEEARLAFNEITKPKTKPKKAKSNKTFINPNYEIPLCIKYIYANGAGEGQRNNTLIVLASALLQKGVELEQCIDECNTWNEEKNDPALGSAEVEATVRSAYRNLMDGRRYGCASIQEIGACVGNQCKLYR